MAFRDFAQERLDEIASDFLEAHGICIAAEPGSQVVGWMPPPKDDVPPEPPKPLPVIEPKPVAPPKIDWSLVPAHCRLPAASFFDLPRPIKHLDPEKCACGAERFKDSTGHCKRCSKRETRGFFVEKWEGRFPEGPAAAVALAEFIMDGAAPDPLIDGIQDAIDRDAGLEAFRALAGLYRPDFIQDRDGKVALHKTQGRKKTGPRGWKAREFYAVTKLPMPTVAQMRELLHQPRYWNGGWYDNATDWDEGALRDLWALCHGNAPLDKAAARLARKPSAIAHRARDAGLKLPLSWKLAIAAPKAIKKPPRQVAYPYLAERKPEHELLLRVNEFIPPGIPGREDACQALLLALLEGTVLPDALVGKLGQQNRRSFLNAMRRENFEMSGFAKGLDDPILDEHGSDTGQTLMGMI